MAEILLNTGKLCLVDEEDLLSVGEFSWWELRGPCTSYVVRSLSDNTKLYLHREITNCPKDRYVDHINGNGLDNRRSNLRIVTSSENNFNTSKRKNTTSKYLGVHFRKHTNKWCAKGKSKLGVQYHLGDFTTEIEAALAYNNFILKYNPFCKLNTIEVYNDKPQYPSHINQT